MIALLLIWSSVATATDPPHSLETGCDACHNLHGAVGSGITDVEGNANLCISCHALNGNAWADVDQADPGVSGTSHRWDAESDQPQYGASTPTNFELARRLDGTVVQCSTCHDQHLQTYSSSDPSAPTTPGEAGRHFQRIDNLNDEMCRDCHAARDMDDAGPGTWTGDPLSHPVGAELWVTATHHNPPLDNDGNAQIDAEYGTATGGSTTSLVDTSKSWGDLTGLVVRFTSGANGGLTATITSMTGGQQIDFDPMPSPVAANDGYEIDSDGNLSNNLVLATDAVGSYTAGDVVCSSCHSLHYADSDPDTYDGGPGAIGDGYLLRRGNDEMACEGCHNVLNHNSANLTERYGTWGADFTCRTCHDIHGSANIQLVSETISTPNSGDHAVDFRSSGGGAEPYGNADSLVPGSGICETCHTNTRNGDLYTIGTANFVAGASTVTCADTCNWDTQLIAGWEILRDGDSSSQWTRVASVTASTITLAEGYKGTSGVGSTYSAANPRFRNTGSGGGAVGDEHWPGEDCISCHRHENAFAHGAGSTTCVDCHGHDDGYGGDTYYGTTGTHSTHTDGDADDLHGPVLACSDCHDTGAFPTFVSGVDMNGDGKYNLSETDVCDTCHSPFGSYDGVDDPLLGAKNNWVNGVYFAGALDTGYEKWCATCHDEVPSEIDGVTASNVIGDEDGDFKYGVGFGFYETGHGLPATETYPASGGITDGAGLGCEDCHDPTVSHIDGEPRTFDDLDLNDLDPMNYRLGYRLSLVGGLEPMMIPRTAGTGNTSDQARLCYACHDSGPFIDGANMNTNSVTGGVNRHAYHLNRNESRYTSDWGGVINSRMTCNTCHNVHGSNQLTMIRDGKLLDREPGLQMWYNNDDFTDYVTWTPNPPSPEDVPLTASTGKVWIQAGSGNFCTHCHGNGNTNPNYRGVPVYPSTNAAPVLEWTGQQEFVADGVYPDAGPGGSEFTFRVTFSDLNNEMPAEIEVWIDEDDSGAYDDPSEMYALVEASPGDLTTYQGKIYQLTRAIAHPADGDIDFRFYASDGIDDATGSPTSDQILLVDNTPPTLELPADEPLFADNGVDPNTGAVSSDFEFRVDYFDINDDPPASMELWVDVNIDGDYNDPGEQLAMDEVTPGDTVYTDGKRYTETVTLTTDGSVPFEFFAADTEDVATGDPTSQDLVEVTTGNEAPILYWVGDTADYTDSGVDPNPVLLGTYFGEYLDFRVLYVDRNDDAPTVIQVWMDLNDDDIRDPGEWTALTEEDAGDTNVIDGKIYGATISPVWTGDTDIGYAFEAFDGAEYAAGTPTSDSQLTGIYAVNVAASPAVIGVDCDYNVINNAVVTNPGAVLVGPGTYSEGVGTGNRTITIVSLDGAAATIISRPTDGYTLDCGNSGNVVLRGFTLTHSGGAASRAMKGGYLATVLLEECVISGNDSGIHTNGTILTINDSVIEDNGILGTTSGAAIFMQGATLLTINDSVFQNNQGGTGGALYFQNGPTAHVTNTTFANNSVDGIGGAIYTNGGMASNGSYFLNCTFDNNTATSLGGAYYSNNPSSPEFNGCLFTNNHSDISGGVAFLNSSSAPTFNNSVFDGNSADDMGGVVFTNSFTTEPTFNNCTFVNNYADDRGGVLRINGSWNVTVNNSVFWGNSAGWWGNICDFNGQAVLNINDVMMTQYPNDFSAANTWELNITGFQSDENPNLDANYRLQYPSAAIDNANAAYAPAVDIDNEVRPQGGGDDLGADEYIP